MSHDTEFRRQRLELRGRSGQSSCQRDRPFKCQRRGEISLKVARNETCAGSFTSASAVPAPITRLLPLAKTTDANPTIGLGGGGEGVRCLFDAVVPWLSGPAGGLEYFSVKHKQHPPPRRRTKRRRPRPVRGKNFPPRARAAPPRSPPPPGMGRSPTFVPVMMNFGSSVAGACGAVIFWKARRAFHHRAALRRVALHCAGRKPDTHI